MTAVVAALVLATAPAARAPAFQEYPAALEAARSRGVPLLVDVWAPW